MKAFATVLACALLAACATTAATANGAGKTPAVANQPLHDELLRMEAQDQAIRDEFPSDLNTPAGNDFVRRLMASDAARTARMKQILAEHGWPTRAQLGNDGAAAAWLLVQHADADPDFQRSVLKLMEPLTRTGEVKPKVYAYLWDRTHEPQRYGTQGKCAGKNDWQPLPMETPGQVDARRAQVGLGTLAEYAAEVSQMCK